MRLAASHSPKTLSILWLRTTKNDNSPIMMGCRALFVPKSCCEGPQTFKGTATCGNKIGICTQLIGGGSAILLCTTRRGCLTNYAYTTLVKYRKLPYIPPMNIRRTLSTTRLSSTTASKSFLSKDRREQMRDTASQGASTFKTYMKKYGYVFVGTYLTLYVTTLGTLFVGVNWGWIDPATITFGHDKTKENVSSVDDHATVHDDDDENHVTIKNDDDTEEEQHHQGEYHHERRNTPTKDKEEKAATKKNQSAYAIVEYLNRWEWSKPYAKRLERNPSMVNLGIAWIATKFTEPVRLALAIAVTPRLARFFRRVPVPSSSSGTAAAAAASSGAGSGTRATMAAMQKGGSSDVAGTVTKKP